MSKPWSLLPLALLCLPGMVSAADSYTYTGNDRTVSYRQPGTGRTYELTLTRGKTYPARTVENVMKYVSPSLGSKFSSLVTANSEIVAPQGEYLYTGETRTVSYRNPDSGKIMELPLVDGHSYPGTTVNKVLQHTSVPQWSFSAQRERLPSGAFRGHNRTVSYSESGSRREYYLDLVEGHRYSQDAIDRAVKNGLASYGDFGQVAPIVSKMNAAYRESVESGIPWKVRAQAALAQEKEETERRQNEALQKEGFVPLDPEKLKSAKARAYAERYVDNVYRDLKYSPADRELRIRNLLSQPEVMNKLWASYEEEAERDRRWRAARKSLEFTPEPLGRCMGREISKKSQAPARKR